MIKKSVFEDELIAGMQRELQPFEKKAAVNDLVKAAEYLHSAVEIFEEAGMSTKADQVLRILAKIAHDEGSEKIEKMIEESLEPMDTGGNEPLDMDEFYPLSQAEKFKMRTGDDVFSDDNSSHSQKSKELEPGDEIEMKSILHEPKDPEVFEFTSLLEPKALPPDGEELVFKSIAQELGLLDDNDAKPRKPKNPTKVHVPTSEQQLKNLADHGTVFNMADDGFADDLLDLEISENPLEVTETSAGKTFEDSD